MALIYTYPPIGNIEDADLLLVSDVSLASNATRNMALGTFATYIIGSRSIITGEGTKDTIPVFTGDTSIGDSVMTAVTGGLQIAGGLSINTFLTVTGGVVMGGALNVEGQTTLEDALSVDGDVYIDSGLTVNEDTTLSDVATQNIVANGAASFKFYSFRSSMGY